MKKLFILTPTVLLTAMLYSAEITVLVVDDKDQTIVLPKFRQMNLSAETFRSLSEKIYNTEGVVRRYNEIQERGPVKDLRPGLEIGSFDWRSEEDGLFREHVVDSTTLSEAGIYDGQIMFSVLVPILEIKEPDIE